MESENKYKIKEKEIKVLFYGKNVVNMVGQCSLIIDGEDFVVSIELLKAIAEPTPWKITMINNRI